VWERGEEERERDEGESGSVDARPVDVVVRAGFKLRIEKLPFRAIHHVYVDRDGSIWLGSGQSGQGLGLLQSRFFSGVAGRPSNNTLAVHPGDDRVLLSFGGRCTAFGPQNRRIGASAIQCHNEQSRDRGSTSVPGPHPATSGGHAGRCGRRPFVSGRTEHDRTTRRLLNRNRESHGHPVLDADKHRRPRLHLRPVSIRSTKGAKQSTTV
jgi:hypothetical protein